MMVFVDCSMTAIYRKKEKENGLQQRRVIYPLASGCFLSK